MPFRSQPQRLVPFSECKSTAFLHNHQTFFALFSRPFCEKYAHFMHKALKNSQFAPRKNFSTFLAADCKCEKKIRLLQENNMKIGPNMLNNIFIALRTPPVPSPTPQNTPRLPAFRPPPRPVRAGSRGTKRRCRGNFLPRRGNFFPRHPFPAETGTEKRRCYVKNFTYNVSFFTYNVIFFT